MGKVAVALFDCTGDDEQELTFKTGDVIVDVRPADDEGDDWLEGRIKGTNTVGLFPSNYVRFIEEEPSAPPLPPRDPPKIIATPTIHPDGTVYPRPLVLDDDDHFKSIVRPDPKEMAAATRMALLEKSNAFIRTGRERAASTSSSRDSSGSRKIQASASFPVEHSHHPLGMTRRSSNDSTSTSASTSPRLGPRRLNSMDSNASAPPGLGSLIPPRTPPRPFEQATAKRPALLLANQMLEPPAMPPRPDTPPYLSPSLSKTKQFFSSPAAEEKPAYLSPSLTKTKPFFSPPAEEKSAYLSPSLTKTKPFFSSSSTASPPTQKLMTVSPSVSPTPSDEPMWPIKPSDVKSIKSGDVPKAEDGPLWAGKSVKPSELKAVKSIATEDIGKKSDSGRPAWAFEEDETVVRPSQVKALTSAEAKSVSVEASKPSWAAKNADDSVVRPSQVKNSAGSSDSGRPSWATKPLGINTPSSASIESKKNESRMTIHGLASTGLPKPWEVEEAMRKDATLSGINNQEEEEQRLIKPSDLLRTSKPLAEDIPKASPVTAKKYPPPPPPPSKPVDLKGRDGAVRTSIEKRLSMAVEGKRPPPPPPPSKGVSGSPVPGRSSTLGRRAPPPPPPASKTVKKLPPCPIPEDAKSWYDAAFLKFDKDRDGFMTGMEVRTVWRRSRLDSLSLGLIWLLVDSRRKMKLDKEEFW
ncbi:hypothetical protein HDU67_006315 [Dinochytrium kinnereticum]|nr:hypothetical protein HDU67_006315 [Dinochytrium kinnereticum]